MKVLALPETAQNRNLKTNTVCRLAEFDKKKKKKKNEYTLKQLAEFHCLGVLFHLTFSSHPTQERKQNNGGYTVV